MQGGRSTRRLETGGSNRAYWRFTVLELFTVGERDRQARQSPGPAFGVFVHFIDQKVGSALLPYICTHSQHGPPGGVLRHFLAQASKSKSRPNRQTGIDTLRAVCTLPYPEAVTSCVMLVRCLQLMKRSFSMACFGRGAGSDCPAPRHILL